MNQKTAVNKVLKELIENGLVSKEIQGKAIPFLDQLYAAGFDHGRTPDRHFKPTLQLSLKGKPIKAHESIAEAARQTGTYPSSIGLCMNGKMLTAGGFKWKHISKANYENSK